MPPNAEDFSKALNNLLSTAESLGCSSVDVVSGKFYKTVDKWPPGNANDGRMPTCCEVLLKAMRESQDKIIEKPENEKGYGAILRIRYQLPHPGIHKK